jgi:amino-acid N-acetyltransferase
MLRKAGLDDVKQIHGIVNAAAAQGEMLPRALGELYDNVRDYYVMERDGTVVGTCALHICWDDLAEVRSLCVTESFRRQGIGRQLVDACLSEAKEFGIGRVFLLTYRTGFFTGCGFAPADKKELPQKIWSDCVRCPKFPECDETAMIIKVDA